MSFDVHARLVHRFIALAGQIHIKKAGLALTPMSMNTLFSAN